MPTSAKGSIEIRDIRTIEEYRAVEGLQIEAWGDDERDIVPLSQLVGASYVGGSLIGAFDDKRLAGFAYGFYGHLAGSIVHHSHMLAVDPAYRKRNLGFELKAAQRQHVLADGITDRMTWTFDPLQSLNAHFNFAKLGVVSDTYKVNVYGEMGSSFLHRNGTDRLLVTWLLKDPRVEELLDNVTGRREHGERGRHAVRLLRNSDSDKPVFGPSVEEAENAKLAAIEIPTNIVAIEKRDFDLARDWREATRRVFSEAIDAGFVVTDFISVDGRTGSYFLERTNLDEPGE